ncbi:MAG TPA: hypothetical protein VFI06_02780 [Chitinophagaceae bacterium]|nr:hypothetical protein [Chitinophagaceae bacterium]
MNKDADMSFSGTVKIKSRHHDIGRFFSSMPPGVLFILIVVGYTAIIELGVFLGYQKFIGKIHVADNTIQTAVTAVFGLLAFILGFTFSLTWSRYANRSKLIISQAKAIGICYLRCSFIPEKQKIEIRRLLYDYTDLLIKLPGGIDLEHGLSRIEQLHRLIWQQTASLAKEEMDGELRSIFIGSINDMISIVVERKTVALIFKIPDAIWSTLLFLGFVGMLAFGYQAGVEGLRKHIQLPWLPVAFGLVIVLISDLNSSHSQRHFKVPQQPLKDLIRMMDSNIS